MKLVHLCVNISEKSIPQHAHYNMKIKSEVKLLIAYLTEEYTACINVIMIKHMESTMKIVTKGG